MSSNVHAGRSSDPRTLGLLAIIGSSLILSTGSTVVKETGSPGAVVAMWRLWLASLFWLGYLLWTRQRLDRAALRDLAPVGAVYGLNFALFFSAARMTRIANIEFVGTLAPVVLVPISVVFLKERVSRRAVAAGVTAMAGVALVLFFAPTQVGVNNWAGNLVAVGAVFTWCAYLLAIRRARQRYSTALMLSCVTFVATAVATPIGLATRQAFSVSTKGAVLIVLMTVSNGIVAHSLIAWAQGKVSVATISLIQLSQPVLAVLCAYLVLHESVRPVQLVGMAVVIVAVAVIGVEATRRAPAPASIAVSS